MTTVDNVEKIHQIRINVDGLSSVTRNLTGVPHRVRIKYCDYALPFFGTREQATNAALGLAKGCEIQVKNSYGHGWYTIELDGEILIDTAI